MKKLFSVLLGALLLLGFATMASASTAVVGKLELLGSYDVKAREFGWEPDIARFEVTGNTALFEDAFTAGMKIRLNPIGTTTVQLRDWNINYKLTDSFSIGALYYCTADLFYLFDGPITNVSLIGQFAKAAYAFEGGSAVLYSDLQQNGMNFIGTAKYAADTFGGAGAVTSGPTVGSDVYLTGFYKLGDIKVEVELITGTSTLVGGKVSYGTEDTFIVGGGLQYDVNAQKAAQVVGDFTKGKFYAEGSYSLNTAKPVIYLYGEYALADNLLLWAEYDKDENNPADIVNAVLVGFSVSF